MKRGYSIEEAAEVLSVTRRSVWNYIRLGRLKTRKVKSGDPGRWRTQVDGLSLFKWHLRKDTLTYRMRDYMIKCLDSKFFEKIEMAIALKEAGILEELEDLVFEDYDLSGLFDEDGELLDELQESAKELWDRETAAAYLECSVSTVGRYERGGKLKAVQTDPGTGKRFYLNFDVMELYAKKKGVQPEGNCDENSGDFPSFWAVLAEHPEVVAILSEVLRDMD